MDINIKNSKGFQIGNQNTQKILSWNKVPKTENDELQKLVSELKKAVESHSQPTENAIQPIAKPVKSIVNELEESEPDASILKTQASRLVQAADAVGKVAPPVLDAANVYLTLCKKLLLVFKY